MFFLSTVCALGFNVQHHPTRTATFLHSSSVAEPSESEYSASKLRSLKFVQLTKQTEPALLADYLMEIGASSVAITDHDADTENENPIFAEPLPGDDTDIFAAVVCGDAAVGKNVWLRCDVTAHFGESYDPLAIVDNVRASFDLGATPRYVWLSYDMILPVILQASMFLLPNTKGFVKKIKILSNSCMPISDV